MYFKTFSRCVSGHKKLESKRLDAFLRGLFRKVKNFLKVISARKCWASDTFEQSREPRILYKLYASVHHSTGLIVLGSGNHQNRMNKY